METRLPLTLSLCLNLALAAGAFLAVRPAPAPVQVPPLAAVAEPIRPAQTAPAPEEAPQTTIQFKTNRFHWSHLESTNYFTYAANLRQIDCPEKTVRDILLAEINEDFELREASISIPAPYWISGADRAAVDRAERQARIQLWDQRESLLNQLGLQPGPTDGSHDNFEVYATAIGFFIIGPAPLESSQAVASEFRRADELESQVRERTVDLPDEQKELLEKECQARLLQRISSILSPAQYDEFTMRTCALQMMDDVVEDFVPTSTELRGMAGIFREITGFGQKVTKLLDSPSLEDAQKAELQRRFRAFLGDYRYGQLQEKGDSGFFQ